ncbi:MAG: hypothetical protein COW70_08770 [Hydrogenophilales bacterium CG18_big_fil_WC_8_21_14_2_50_58_12]|nr:MAG: hypothetical protein COW70_08770 [Hydrogenophilales bacterium CG18_big_fil_WC_8_21_14_2_50_58_12]
MMIFITFFQFCYGFPSSPQGGKWGREWNEDFDLMTRVVLDFTSQALNKKSYTYNPMFWFCVSPTKSR